MQALPRHEAARPDCVIFDFFSMDIAANVIKLEYYYVQPADNFRAFLVWLAVAAAQIGFLRTSPRQSGEYAAWTVYVLSIYPARSLAG